MKDRYILAAALAFSILGTALLWYSAASIEPDQVSIGEVGSEDCGRAVVIEGLIIDVGSSKGGSVFLELSDGTGKIDVPLFPDVAGKIEKRTLVNGRRIKVSGIVGEYEGNLQVVPSRAESVVVLGSTSQGGTGLLENDSIEYISISEVDEDLLGKKACIRGQVTDVFYHEKGHVFLDVSDDSGTIDVPLFLGIGAVEVGIGAQVRICGAVETYNGKLEVVPESEGDILASIPEIPAVKIGELGEADVDRIVRVEGRAVDVSYHSKGHIFLTLNDGTGEIPVAIFSTTVEREGIKGVGEGDSIEAAGKVSIYKGALEIIASGVDIG